MATSHSLKKIYKLIKTFRKEETIKVIRNRKSKKKRKRYESQASSHQA